jgi:hypothetical protein
MKWVLAALIFGMLFGSRFMPDPQLAFWICWLGILVCLPAALYFVRERS